MEPPQDTLAEGPPDVRADGHGPGEHVWRHESAPGPRRGIAGKFTEQPVLNTVLAALCIALIVLAVTAIGPASGSGGQTTRTASAKQGVVQSTVSGSGNVQSANQLNLGFKTSGTVTHIYVKEGQHVTRGELLATLDPGDAEVSLEQAKATLQSAEANLAKLEETEGETTGGQGASSASTGTSATATTSDVAYVADASASTPTHTTGSAPSSTTTGPSTTTGTSTTPTTTPSKSSAPTSKKSAGATQQTNTSGVGTSSSQDASGASQAASSSSTKQSAATREANLASAKATVKSDKLAVQSAEQAVQATKLYAPESGTIVSLSGEVGETVSGTGTTKASSSSTSGSSGSGSSATGTGAKSGLGGGSTASSSSSSSQGASSSTSFAVLNNLSSLQLVVALSESEINNVHVGQIATVTIEALDGRKVGAHVVSVSQVPTSSTGAVSYDVTFQLDQEAEGLKVGMSATAEVVVQQAEGVNVPTSAIKAGSVTVLHSGKQETRRVSSGLAGDSSTIVLSGLKAGETVLLPTTTSSGSSLSSRLGSRLRSGGLGGGLGGGGFAGAGAFAAGGPPG